MNVIKNEYREPPKTLIQQLISIYEKLESLPLEEILNAIDLLAHELPKISAQYEINSSMSWQEWFKKYWWAPPLIVGTIAVETLLILRKSDIFIRHTTQQS